MVGETLSHDRVLERLGGGGMGVVYRAEDLRLGRAVAPGFLSAELSRDPDALERFRHEARVASGLDHPNICTIYDIDETPDGRLFIAMAFCQGGTLRDRLAAGGIPLPPALCASPDRLPTLSRPRLGTASCIATSSPPT
jgi:serine/threonine protein kinase